MTAPTEPQIELATGIGSLPTHHMGPFIRNGQGDIVTVDENQALISSDEGKSWQAFPLFPEGVKTTVRIERTLLRTCSGAIILAYLDQSLRRFDWDDDLHAPVGDARMPLKTIRSLDEGRTWQGDGIIQEGWCGSVRDMVQSSSGDIVLAAQRLVHNPAHHTVVTFRSSDDGRTWQASPCIDIGGRGHHDGAYEPTLIERADRQLWMLLRTNHDYQWETSSSDDGRSWDPPRMTLIDSSSAPALLTRLQNGRLLLLWNRVRLEDGSDTERHLNPNLAAVAASWQRVELSAALSEDDGVSWGKPLVIARRLTEGMGIAYPYCFEAAPGQLWVTTMFGDLRCLLPEALLEG